MTSKLRNAAKVLNHRQRYATFEELDWLRAMAGHLPADGLAIILGAGPGVMLAALKDGNPTLHVFLIDNDTCDYAIAHMSEFGPEYQKDVFGFVGDSAAVGTRYQGRMCDLLIIDGDHTERGVTADIISWLGHVKPDGYIVLHDYDASDTWFQDQERYPGVKLAADRLLGPYTRLQEDKVGTSAIFVNRLREASSV